MAKKGKKGTEAQSGTGTEKTEPGDQLMLLDIQTPEAKAFNEKFKTYKKKQGQRLAFLKEEIALKTELLPLAHALGLTPDSEGVIRFEIGDVEVEVIPSKETIKVTVKKPPKKVKVKED